MIKVFIYRNPEGHIYGFTAEAHGDPIVCSAVSMLTINAANSVETFTDEHIICEYDEAGGFLHFEMPDIKAGAYQPQANLLMESMLLGLKSVENDYNKHIQIVD